MTRLGDCKKCEGSGSVQATDGEYIDCCSECGGSGQDDGLSSTYHSCLYCARAARQKLPTEPYTVPDRDTRLLRARLILEEAKETIRALGYDLDLDNVGEVRVNPEPCCIPNLEQIIDGVCDVTYVAIGTLVACGVPDLVHMEEVIRANNDKFPGGKGVKHPEIEGKFGKPEGWKGPNHEQFYPKKETP